MIEPQHMFYVEILKIISCLETELNPDKSWSILG